ncbi:uncharacterized protein LOC100573978 [Acyrthosiphon pisum]|uniref:HAT C-terminal dimerisation domain-containing protein n=1 Tax=Acyrthosiphon pisum TaxID=7029 RepID=A0A8R2NNN1_ACYPI|nr:uncharacterized protein LOC100573978 [Acyrthosiphon pisum]
MILIQLIPKHIIHIDDKMINTVTETIVTHYKFDDEALEESQLKSEIELWKEKWNRIKSEDGVVLTDALTSMDQCNEILYPNIKKILHIIACLPVSVASAERSFSTLRRLKTWLRSNMGEERLVGLALLNIHRHRTVEVDEVIDLFAGSKKRNLDFVI